MLAALYRNRSNSHNDTAVSLSLNLDKLFCLPSPDSPRLRAVRRLVRAFAIGLLVAALLGCSSRQQTAATGGPSGAIGPTSDNAPSPAAEAKLKISYARPDDFLTALAVTKYSGAQTLATSDTKSGSAAVIRFEGGVVVWQIGAEKSLLSNVPVVGRKEDKPYAITELKYGMMPAHFTATIPDGGSPEPLEPGNYYVFTVTRSSGSISYEAVKVNGDGSLEAYDAEPRAGTSYRLCCNIAADFTLTAGPAPSGSPNP
jgi:hypothetical protein